MSPAASSEALPGFQSAVRLGQSYRLSERWNWGLQGVFSYANYYASHGKLSRIGLGVETGPELTLVPHLLSLALYGGFQEGFFYSPEVTWPSSSGIANFDNASATSLSLRPALSLFGGIFTASFEWAHDFGVEAPGPTRFDAPQSFQPNRFSAMLSLDLLKSFYAARGGFEGAADSFEEFLLGIRPSAIVEGSYNYSFMAPAGPDGTPGVNAYRTNNPLHHRPRLNLVELALERPSTPRSPLGFRVDANFGQDPISFAPKSSLIEPVIGARGGADTQYFALQQAYLTYLFPVAEGLTLRLGQFGTTVGNEVPEAPLNTFLLPTRGLNNTLAEPFFHAGGTATLRISQTTDTHGDEDESNDETTSYTEAVLGVVNGWDSVLGHEGGPTVVTGFNHMVNPEFAYSLNYLIGREGEGVQGLFNFNATYKPNGQWTLGTNLDLGHGNNPDTGAPTLWFGLGLYQQFAPASWFNLAAREEVFTDPQGARTGIHQTLLSAALAANFLIPYGFGVSPEIRHDQSLGREEGVPGPFQSGADPSSGNTTFTLRVFWKYPF